jgi:carboxylesterase
MSKKPYGILILHGFTSSLDCVREVEPPLKALGLPTRMPVLRGHGAESPEALRGVRWPDWVADANSALNDLLAEADKAIVVGLSMGALVAINLAADHGDKIDSIILASPAILFTSPLAPGKPLGFLRPLVGRLVKNWDTPPEYTDKSLEKYNTNYLYAPMDSVVSLLDFSQAARKRLPEVKTPALILHSHKDTVLEPKSAEVVLAELGTPADRKKIVWFEKTNHEIFRDCERQAAIQTIAQYVRGRVGSE